MSDRINQLVDTIREKAILLKDQVASEKAHNQELTQEIQTLKQEMSSRDEKVDESQRCLGRLRKRSSATNIANVRGQERESGFFVQQLQGKTQISIRPQGRIPRGELQFFR